MNSRPKKSRSSKRPAKVGTARRAVRVGNADGRHGVASLPSLPQPTGDHSVQPNGTVRRPALNGRGKLRAEYRAWRAVLPTPLERDTLLWPEAIAESVVAEASRYLGVALPADYPARLAAKAYHLYPRHRHFHEVLNRPGNRGRDYLYMYMRHWTAGWLKRERRALFRRLPWEYALGSPLPKPVAMCGGVLAGRARKGAPTTQPGVRVVVPRRAPAAIRFRKKLPSRC